MSKKIKNIFIKKDKFFVKSSLILMSLVERLIFLMAAVAGALILVKLFRGTFEHSLENYLRIIAYLILDLTGHSLYRLKFLRYKKASKFWKKIPPLLDESNNSHKSNNKFENWYKKYISEIKDYNIYSFYLIVILLTTFLIIFSFNIRMALIAWVFSFSSTFFLFINYSKIFISKKMINMKNYLKSTRDFLSKKIKINLNVYQLLNSYIILLLVISFILFPVKEISLIESLLAVFGIRQILSAIRAILLKTSIKSIVI